MDARGLNNTELGDLAGVNESTLSRLRRGIDPPGIGVLRKIAPHIGVRLGDLLVAADLATREELGMAGAPPPPGPPLPTVLRRVVARMLNPKIPDRRKQQLLTLIDRCEAMWYENLQDEVFSEPKMTSARSVPRRR